MPVETEEAAEPSDAKADDSDSFLVGDKTTIDVGLTSCLRLAMVVALIAVPLWEAVVATSEVRSPLSSDSDPSLLVRVDEARNEGTGGDDGVMLMLLLNSFNRFSSALHILMVVALFVYYADRCKMVTFGSCESEVQI